MAADIVPIRLGLTEGDFVTLWAPRWVEDDEEWEAFLGRDDDLYVFRSVSDLVAFVRSGADNDLVDHPAWPVVSQLSAVEFEPDDRFSFDLVGVPELAAGSPEPLTVSDIDDAMQIVRSIGDVCELEAVDEFFAAHPDLAELPQGRDAYYGRSGAALWSSVGTALAQDWDPVLDALDALVTVPKVDAAVAAEIESELVADRENTLVDSDDEDDDEYEYDGDEDTNDETDELDFWGRVGIDPIKIILTDGEWYTLRCYLDDDAVFLGDEGAISVFGSDRALARYLADHHEHDLATLSTYDEIRNAATDGSLEVSVTDDNVYVLPGIADDISEGPAEVDPDQLDLAVELFTDAADYADDDSTEDALGTDTELGRLVAAVTSEDDDVALPEPPYDAEAQQWRALEHEFEARLRKQ